MRSLHVIENTQDQRQKSFAYQMKTITLQINVPVSIEVSVSEVSQDAILDAAWNDLKDPNSKNSWSPSYWDLKDVLRNPEFLDEDWEDFVANDREFIVAYN
jgi:hypothetical protein